MVGDLERELYSEPKIRPRNRRLVTRALASALALFPVANINAEGPEKPSPEYVKGMPLQDIMARHGFTDTYAFEGITYSVKYREKVYNAHAVLNKTIMPSDDPIQDQTLKRGWVVTDPEGNIVTGPRINASVSYAASMNLMARHGFVDFIIKEQEKYGTVLDKSARIDNLFLVTDFSTQLCGALLSVYLNQGTGVAGTVGEVVGEQAGREALKQASKELTENMLLESGKILIGRAARELKRRALDGEDTKNERVVKDALRDILSGAFSSLGDARFEGRSLASHDIVEYESAKRFGEAAFDGFLYGESALRTMLDAYEATDFLIRHVGIPIAEGVTPGSFFIDLQDLHPEHAKLVEYVAGVRDDLERTFLRPSATEGSELVLRALGMSALSDPERVVMEYNHAIADRNKYAFERTLADGPYKNVMLGYFDILAGDPDYRNVMIERTEWIDDGFCIVHTTWSNEYGDFDYAYLLKIDGNQWGVVNYSRRVAAVMDTHKELAGLE